MEQSKSPQDIEDVLSSIRRLVANDAPAMPPANPRAPGTPEDTLVLAPTQRVTDPEDPFQMIRSLAQEERDARDAPHVLAEVEADVGAIARDLATAEVEAFWSETASDQPVEDLPEEFSPSEPMEEPEAPAPDLTTADDLTQAPEVTRLPLPPRETQQQTTTLSQDTSDGPTPATEGSLADVMDGIGDDDALRQLIAEIVRQELAGALGERITRNVRKLVRRELRQALSSGEFD
ncbi:hypothetical protein JANAI62_36060 [Jannaschia pagri]|uniref:Uncharacterized protein n=1 Tax=Jannaschia pagri TaxID=2829797 RepID=A0ABQ4NRF0_9RHOB|nr:MULTISPECIES: hypothetical protein [unclassified Jannaschia]GIT93110.1 hypothetical protein JANAI61_35680 [Jannaschia sp. AI_61]GIT96983.1 hypothetical protein JANAI62_36060 [Jannaschia sp. AI_62]